ncbi:DUF1573 domain-containing protein [Rubripirellula reticaptiva]|uniref:DUF1573 domain-containing protein n=1 Tax=Rubripirellula reticaptiva TaxID=2528013 RepID=UPI001644BD6F|nr:DUF1573 domain-containing protein [Rubripirellula reticaptiva]
MTQNILSVSLALLSVAIAAGITRGDGEETGSHLNNESDQTEQRLALCDGRSIVSLGVARPGDKLSAAIRLNNEKESTQRITGATVSCGCLKVVPGRRVVLARSSTLLKVYTEAGKRTGRHEQTVTLNGVDDRKESFVKQIVFYYDIVGDFQLSVPSNRWMIDRSSSQAPTLEFVLRGFRETDLKRVDVDVNGVEVQVSRTSVAPRGDESSREVCVATLVDPSSIVSPLAITVSASYLAEGHVTESSMSERIVLINKPSVTIYPKSPRIEDGNVVVFARLLSDPVEGVRFRLRQRNAVALIGTYKKLGPRFYQVDFGK